MLAAPAPSFLVAGNVDQGPAAAELEGTVPKNLPFLSTESAAIEVTRIDLESGVQIPPTGAVDVHSADSENTVVFRDASRSV